MSLRSGVPFHLRRAHRFLNRALLQRIADFGLSAEQYAILRSLQASGEVRQTELVHDFCSDPSTVTTMLALLERQGIVRRRTDAGDGRVRRVSLSPRGARLAEALFEVTRPIRKGIDKSLSKREQATLIELLDRLVAGVTSTCAAAEVGDASDPTPTLRVRNSP